MPICVLNGFYAVLLPYPLLVQMGTEIPALALLLLKNGMQGGIGTKPAEWFKRQW